ncbi:hypothetical protein FACS189411_16860 [Bacteroidia bacterium]|nr:hypothetical protein FACS189411_16860 [Bacteroidia bacterium]
MEQFFKQIEQQTPYTVAYNHSKIDLSKKRSIPDVFVKTTLKDALSYMLKKSSFSYKINGRHILILAEEERFNIKDGGQGFVYKGKVIDSQTKEALNYATISLIDSENHVTAVGASNDEGSFYLTPSQIPQTIRISFIGYETLVEDIHTMDGELGIFPLSTADNILQETIISANRIQYKIDRIIYQITTQMCKGIMNTQELLDKIQSVRFDKTSNTIYVGNQTSVLLLVDGMQQPPEYIRTIAPQRISKIEIVYELSGRYLSENYSSIINIIMKDNYTGYDIYVSNTSAINPSGTNGKDWMAEERPVVGITYATNKINLYGTYSYNRDRWNMPVSKELTYDGVELLSDKRTTDNPNDLYKYHNNNLNGGLVYHLAYNQTLSFQGDYSEGNTYTERIYTMQKMNVWNNVSKGIIKNTTKNNTKDNMASATLYYQGQLTNRFRLNGDFTYNYYYNDIENEYNQNDYMNYEVGDLYNEYKHHSVFNMDMSYQLSPQTFLDAGYSNIWRKYGSGSSSGRGFLDYTEYHNHAFAYLTYNPSAKINAKLGAGIEYGRTHNRDKVNHFTYILPYIQLNYKPSRTLNINMSYSTNQYYPILYQLSPMTMVIDTFLTQIGNPDLKSAIKHTVSTRLSFWDKLTITPRYSFIQDDISETYMKNDYKLYRTFSNIDTKEYGIQAGYEQAIGEYLHLKSDATFYHSEARNNGIMNSVNGWLFHGELMYYHPIHLAGVQFGYYRNMRKNIFSQGYQMLDKDNWLITLNKSFTKERLSVMLSYIPPIPLGVRYNQLKEMETSLYKEKSSLNLKTYNNMLFLRVSFRFTSGSIKQSERRSSVKKEEREKRTVEFY